MILLYIGRGMVFLNCLKVCTAIVRRQGGWKSDYPPDFSDQGRRVGVRDGCDDGL